MFFLIRPTKRSVWSDEPPDDARRQRAIAELARRPQDTDGLSVFEVSTDAERDAVLAAFACQREDDTKIPFLEIPRDLVEMYGPIAITEGTTPVPAANALHRSLDWDAATLARFATDLVDRGTRTRDADRATVRRAVAALDPETVLGEKARAFVIAAKSRLRST